MEVRADTTGALIEEGLEDRNRGRRGRDRIVDDVGGNDVVAREDLLRRALRRNGDDAGVVAAVRKGPGALLLGVDHHQQRQEESSVRQAGVIPGSTRWET